MPNRRLLIASAIGSAVYGIDPPRGWLKEVVDKVNAAVTLALG